MIIMAFFLKIACSYAYSLLQYVRLVWPLSLIYHDTTLPLSQQTQRALLNIIRVLKQGDEEEKEKVLEWLEQLPVKEALLEVVDDEWGLDVLQTAVIANRKDVVLWLLSHGWRQKHYHCSPPLHLAVYLGRSALVSVLLSCGAGPASRHGMCFPEPHLPVGSQPTFLGLSKYPVYLCFSHKVTPLECGIKQGHLQCIRQLMDNVKARGLNLDPLACLQFACKEGMVECIRFFASNFPEFINQYGSDGDTPLLSAVPWGEECARVLVELGADVRLVSRGIGENALHRLYRMNIDGLFCIYDTTRYLLTTGIEQDINAMTDLGETVLHMLVSHVSYAGGNCIHPNRQISRAALQQDYQSQVLLSLKAVLQFNADPLLLNGPGLQPLSRMLHIALKVCQKDNPCYCVRTSQPDLFIVEYCNDYWSLQQALDILLAHGAPPNFQCSTGHTPLTLLLQCFLHDDPQNLISQVEAALATVTTLVSGGGSIDLADGLHGKVTRQLAMICGRCLSDDLRRHKVLQRELTTFTDQLLGLLLSLGLNPNHTTNRTSPFMRGGGGNALIEFVRLADKAACQQEFEAVRCWVRTLLQWGADPDLESYPSEPIICHSQSSIFLKKLGTQAVYHYLQQTSERQVVTDLDAGMLGILELFYNSMDHKLLYQSLAAHLSSRYHSPHSVVSGPVYDHFLSTVHMLAESPRSLRQIARVTVYKAVGRQLARAVPSLPVPQSVKQYLLDLT